MIPSDLTITTNSKSGNKRIGSRGGKEWQKSDDWKNGSVFVAATAILIVMLLALKMNDHARVVGWFNICSLYVLTLAKQVDLAMTNGQGLMRMKGGMSGLMILSQLWSPPLLVMKLTSVALR